jgi:hypothetical protein
MQQKHLIQVINKSTGEKIKTIKRVLFAECIGNFNPIFCRYANNKRVLVNAKDEDLSDPFRRNANSLTKLYIEV